MALLWVNYPLKWLFLCCCLQVGRDCTWSRAAGCFHQTKPRERESVESYMDCLTITDFSLKLCCLSILSLVCLSYLYDMSIILVCHLGDTV